MTKLFNDIKTNVSQDSLKKYIRLGFLVIVAGILGNVLFTLITTDRSVLDSLVAFKLRYILLAMGMALIPWLTNTLRVLIWTRFLGHRFSFFQILRIVISTDLGSAVSPTAIGGGYVKAGMLMQNGMSPGASASLMTLGSVEDGIFFLFAVPASIYISSCWDLPIIRTLIHTVKSYLLPASVILVALVLFFFLFRQLKKYRPAEKPFFTHKLFEKFQSHVLQAIRDFTRVYKLIGTNGKKQFAATMFLTSIQWLTRYSILAVLLLAFDIRIDPVLFFLFQWLTFSMMTLIPTPGATAGAEASFLLIYSSLIPGNVIGFMTAAWRFLTFYFHIILGSVIIGLFMLVDMRTSRKKKRSPGLDFPSRRNYAVQVNKINK